MKPKRKNISFIVEHKNCTQCGTCVAMCPTRAISCYQHPCQGLLPVVDDARCTECGICLAVCPGEKLDLPQLNRAVFGRIPADELFGNYIQIYTGYAVDRQIRYNGASGGVATAILAALLKQRRIDGAVVVRMSQTRPLEPEVFIARNTADLISAQQSKYLPVPMNVALREILTDKQGKYAVVGVPCHFHGLRLAEQQNPKLKDRIVLRLGLFCGFNPTLSSTKYLLQRAGVQDFDQVKDIKYRDGDWPCGFRAIMQDGSDHFLYPIEEFLFSHYVFERRRCALCPDHLNELADLALGDEWRSDLRDDAEGWSHIITRTPIGEQIVQEMVQAQVIQVQASKPEVIYSGQRATMIFKKRGNHAFAWIQRRLGNKVPDYFEKARPRLSWRYYLGSLLIWLIPAMFENEFLRRIFVWIPTQVWNRYRLLLLRLFRN